MSKKNDSNFVSYLVFLVVLMIIFLGYLSWEKQASRHIDDRLERLLAGEKGVCVTVGDMDFQLVPNKISPTWKAIDIENNIDKHLPSYKAYLEGRVEALGENIDEIKKDLTGPFIVKTIIKPET